MPQKNRHLIDADYLVSLFFVKDSGHSWSIRVTKQVEKEDFSVSISSPAFGEAITVLSQKAGKPLSVKAAKYILDNPIQIIEVTPKLRIQALKFFKKIKSKNTRFTDCINMAILQSWKTKTIVSRDLHYHKFGFNRLGIDKG